MSYSKGGSTRDTCFTIMLITDVSSDRNAVEKIVENIQDSYSERGVQYRLLSYNSPQSAESLGPVEVDVILMRQSAGTGSDIGLCKLRKLHPRVLLITLLEHKKEQAQLTHVDEWIDEYSLTKEIPNLKDQLALLSLFKARRTGRNSQQTMSAANHKCYQEAIDQNAGNYEKRSLTINQVSPDAPKLNGKVLVAEDCPDTARLLSVLLRNAGLNVSTAENGKHALDTALENEFDLILLDTLMPLMDGHTTAKLIKQKGCCTPVISVGTNSPTEDDIDVVDHIAKPFSRETLYATIAKHLPSLSGSLGSQPTGIVEKNAQFTFALLRFIDNLPEKCARFHEAVEKRDSKTLSLVADQLKGGTLFGFPGLAQLGEAFDHAIAQGQWQELSALGSQLRETVDRIAVNRPSAYPNKVPNKGEARP